MAPSADWKGARPIVSGRSAVTQRRGGRKRSTSRAELEHLAFELFTTRGFDETTIDDIAAAAGIGRRTFFRYFPSKNDIAWGEFDERLQDMRQRFDACPPEVPMMDAIREVVVEFNRVDDAEVPWLRRRMTLIRTVPALQAHSTLRYTDWRRVVAEFAGTRLGEPADALRPQAISHAALGVAIAAYEQWLRDPGAELTSLLDAALRALGDGFG